jgi:type IV pilus assembly protein PilC
LQPIRARSAFFLFKLLRRVRFNEVVNFTRQLSTMITAGLQVTEALRILEGQAGPEFAEVLSQISNEVEGGASLAGAMEKHPKIFSKVYVSLVRAGEAAGVLDEVLKRLATSMEKQREFRSKTKGALTYPAIVMVGMGLVGIIMMVFVIPKLTSMYQDFGAELPGATKILIGLSSLITRVWYLSLLIVVGAVMGLRMWLKTEGGRLAFDQLVLKLPVVGPLITEVVLTDFTRTLSLLVASGISLLEALRIVGRALGNALFEKAVAKAAVQVEKGFPLAATLAAEAVFPPLVPQMVSVGEETGKLDEVLGKLAGYFEMEVEHRIKSLTTAIEPLIMILLGVGVGFLVIAVILPIYNLTSQF